jgi:hypothetical protein
MILLLIYSFLGLKQTANVSNNLFRFADLDKKEQKKPKKVYHIFHSSFFSDFSSFSCKECLILPPSNPRPSGTPLKGGNQGAK